MLAPTQKEQRTHIKTQVTGPAKKGCRNGAGGRSKEEKAKNINKTLD